MHVIQNSYAKELLWICVVGAGFDSETVAEIRQFNILLSLFQ